MKKDLILVESFSRPQRLIRMKFNPNPPHKTIQGVQWNLINKLSPKNFPKQLPIKRQKTKINE